MEETRWKPGYKGCDQIVLLTIVYYTQELLVAVQMVQCSILKC